MSISVTQLHTGHLGTAPGRLPRADQTRLLLCCCASTAAVGEPKMPAYFHADLPTYLPTQVFRNLTDLTVASHIPRRCPRWNKLTNDCITKREKERRETKFFPARRGEANDIAITSRRKTRHRELPVIFSSMRIFSNRGRSETRSGASPPTAVTWWLSM